MGLSSGLVAHRNTKKYNQQLINAIYPGLITRTMPYTPGVALDQDLITDNSQHPHCIMARGGNCKRDAKASQSTGMFSVNLTKMQMSRWLKDTNELIA